MDKTHEAWLKARRHPRSVVAGEHLRVLAPWRFSCPAYGIEGTEREVEARVRDIRATICDGCIVIGDDGRCVGDVLNHGGPTATAIRW